MAEAPNGEKQIGRAYGAPRQPSTLPPMRRLGPIANIDAKLLIYGLFQKGRVLAQDGLAGMMSEACYG